MDEKERQTADKYREEVDRYVIEYLKLDKAYPMPKGEPFRGVLPWPPEKIVWKKQALVELKKLAACAGISITEHNALLGERFHAIKTRFEE